MYDPVKLAEATFALVCRDDARKYYRFRTARFYGGVATADCVGCNLRCAFCWAGNIVDSPEKCGRFYRPAEVAGNLTGMARKKRLSRVRISGNEPTIGRAHLIKVLETIGGRYPFILETNGILIGHDETYAEELSRFEGLYVRVSLKGACEEDFSRLTGALPEAYGLQLKALENLIRHGVNAHPACMISFSSPEKIEELKKRLRSIHPAFEDFEREEIILYPGVEERLKARGLTTYSAFTPQNVPKELI